MPLPKVEWRLPRAKRKGPFSQYINSEKAFFHSENAFMHVEKTCDVISQGLPVSEQDGERFLRTHFRTEIRHPFLGGARLAFVRPAPQKAWNVSFDTGHLPLRVI